MQLTRTPSERSTRKTAAETVALTPDVQLARGRTHEVCGLARRSFAVWLAARMQGPVFWISPAWEQASLNPAGLCTFAEPGRFTFLAPNRAEDVLWTMEESLRAGAVPLVVAELTGLPSLTAVRRLHLAAEQGGAAGLGAAPMGLLLTPDQGGAPGVESRWHMAPAHEPPRQPPFGTDLPGRWRLSRLRARTAPEAHWWITGLPGPAEIARVAAAA
ncbi:ImuA family protein [Pseudaestuariivita sp.]|uniref:ImuA family protein n=1 Tax=Pseudaestuariivita sp. TaxID=2211669 RepID=UPI004059B99B